MPDGVRFKNERQFMKALKAVDADAAKELQKAAREAAKPVAAEAARLAQRYGFTVSSGIRPGSKQGIGIVRQTRGKTTGDHPTFGGLLMRTALLPAVQHQEPHVVQAMEAALDRAISKFNSGGG